MAEPAPVPGAEDGNNPFLSNSQYDKLKWIAQIFLPALATLVVTVFQGWDLPKGTEIAGTIMAVDFFLGALLGVSTKKYKKSDQRFDGVIVVQEEPDKIKANMVLNKEAEEIIGMDEVLFKVATPPPGVQEF